MAIFPGGKWDPLPENATQPKIRPTQIILHTAVDSPGPTRLRSYFAREDVGLESHFWVTLDGIVIQMMNTEVRADANRKANRRPDGTGAISIETEDEGDPIGVPWTAAQLDSLEAIIRWAAHVHSIPLTVCSSPDAPGLGYHSLFGAPSAWTPSAGKTCPGATRIRQFYEILLPRLEPVMSDTMPTQGAADLAAALYRTQLLREPDAAGLTFWTRYGEVNGAAALLSAFITSSQGEIMAGRAADRAAIAALQAEVDALKAAPGGVDVAKITQEVTAAIIGRLGA